MLNLRSEMESASQELSQKYFVISVGPLLKIQDSADFINIFKRKTTTCIIKTFLRLGNTVCGEFDIRKGICRSTDFKQVLFYLCRTIIKDLIS